VDVSIILVNWQSEDYLRECIASIYDWTHRVQFEVIVVDNASPSGNVETLKALFPKIKLLKSAENLGFAGANNLGFRQSAGDCILFLNPDTRLNSPAIDTMMQQLKRLPSAGIVGCKLLNADLSVQTSSIMRFPRIWDAILQVEYLRLRWPKLWGIGPLFSSDKEPSEVEVISGACMLTRREVFEQIGMFSEEYFMYSEDVDLCYHAADVGFKNYYVASATIIHYGGASSPRAWQTAMKTKSELHFFRKNHGPMYSFLFRSAMIINCSGRLAVLAGVRVLAKVFSLKHSADPAWLRWSVMLKTLLASRNSVTERSALPTGS
jgi:N-acetylglucosaminyl-diphospho-decaprenol L-rhamnosyltransferase